MKAGDKYIHDGEVIELLHDVSANDEWISARYVSELYASTWLYHKRSPVENFIPIKNLSTLERLIYDVPEYIK